MNVPRDLLVAVSVHVEAATGVRSVVDRAPATWRTDGDPYIVVTQVSDLGPELTGDGDVLTDAVQVQVSLYEERADETPATLDTLLGSLDRTFLTGRSLAGRVEGVQRIPDPDTDLIQHATTVRYPLTR